MRLVWSGGGEDSGPEGMGEPNHGGTGHWGEGRVLEPGQGLRSHRHAQPLEKASEKRGKTNAPREGVRFCRGSAEK